MLITRYQILKLILLSSFLFVIYNGRALAESSAPDIKHLVHYPLIIKGKITLITTSKKNPEDHDTVTLMVEGILRNTSDISIEIGDKIYFDQWKPNVGRPSVDRVFPNKLTGYWFFEVNSGNIISEKSGDFHWRPLEDLEKIKGAMKETESGKGERLTPPPHTTGHTGP